MNKFFLCGIGIVFSAYSLEKDKAASSYKGKVFEIKAGKTSMKVSANGGRIVSYKMGATEFLTSEQQHENFGSTLWTAPQSDWGWLPYSTLDQEEYLVQETGDTLKMTSKPDLKSGLQFEKAFIAIDNRFIRIDYCIRNISKKEKAVAAWEVTRVPCGGLAFFPASEIEKVPESSLKINFLKNGINWVSIDKKAISAHQKLFATASEGWLAYSFKNVLFVKQFQDTKPADYSPNQGEVEIYTNKEKSYAELENHGPYTLLQPGQSLSYRVNWFLLPVPKEINCKHPNKQLTAYLRKKISSNWADHDHKKPH